MARRTTPAVIPFGNFRDVRNRWRARLPEDNHVVLTHGAFSLANVLVTSQAPYEVVGIIGWGQAGWYPAYWEESRAVLAADLSYHDGLPVGPDFGQWLSELFATKVHSWPSGEEGRLLLEQSQKYTRLFRL